ncbi:serine/threonine protein kinase [Frankia sp. AgB1.9]|nr:serine/threonine protein kinase [Frankia sp. AgW1.1]MBL7550158.1 serine/threonine protein kinase [Frankia sp. AgB1.9]MBL7624991.1 serine/threonine protein kinase [Frankia sp. AgB1.8]
MDNEARSTSGVAVTERSVRPERSSAGPPLPGEPLRSSDPRQIGRYEILSRLGAGGMGAVYLGRDARGRRVAVKVIRGELANDDEFRARFGDEVTAARRVAPFCTAEVLDADPHARNPYLVTEFIDGKRLDEVVEESGPLGMSTLQGVAVGVASALTAIHGAGIVHRDLKPSNVMLSYSGPRVIDFGIARALDAVAGRTRSGIVLGSLGWMAPEQMEGSPVGPATDIFAWGLLIGYAATGVHPYGQGTFYEISERVLTGTPDLSGIPEDLRPVVARTLGRDPRLRPSGEQILLTLLGEPGRSNVRAAATRVLDGTWPGVGGVDPTRIGGPTEAPARSSAAKAAGYGAVAGAAAGYAAGSGLARPDGRGAGGGSAYRGGQEVAPRQPADGGDRYRQRADPRARQAGDGGQGSGYPAGAGGAGRAPGAGGYPNGGGYQAGGAANRAAGRRPRDGYIRYEKPAAPAQPQARPAPPPAAPQAPHRPPYQPPAQARPAPPAPEPVSRRERMPRRRRRMRLHIPFKKTIIFVILVLVLLGSADRIASAVDKKRQTLQQRLVHRIEQQWRHQTGNVGGQLGDQISKRLQDKTGITAPPAPPGQ